MVMILLFMLIFTPVAWRDHKLGHPLYRQVYC